MIAQLECPGGIAIVFVLFSIVLQFVTSLPPIPPCNLVEGEVDSEPAIGSRCQCRPDGPFDDTDFWTYCYSLGSGGRFGNSPSDRSAVVTCSATTEKLTALAWCPNSYICQQYLYLGDDESQVRWGDCYESGNEKGPYCCLKNETARVLFALFSSLLVSFLIFGFAVVLTCSKTTHFKNARGILAVLLWIGVFFWMALSVAWVPIVAVGSVTNWYHVQVFKTTASTLTVLLSVSVFAFVALTVSVVCIISQQRTQEFD